MADRSVDTTDTLEAFRTTFNSTAADVGDIANLNVQFAGTPSDLVEGVNSKAHYTGQNTIVTVGTITTGTWQGTSIDNAYLDNDLTIDGGTVDNSVIGGSTPAAGTFTTLTANDQLIVAAGATITGDTTNEITLAVTGVGSQTANLMTVELSDGTDKFTIAADGSVVIAQDLTLASGATVSAILDEDTMASDSATSLATQQSIKAYVDNLVTIQDLDFAGDSGTGAIDLDSQIFTVSGTVNEIETSASGQTITIGLPSDVTIGNDLSITGNITSGTWQGTAVAVAYGGTGASTAADARTNLGVAIGSDVQAYDADTAKTDVAQTFTTGQRGEITTLTSATTVTIDMDDSNNFTCTMGHNITFANPTNLTAGQSGSIFLVQDGTGSRTASWGTYWDFAGGTAPTLTTTPAAVDRIDYVVRSSTSIHAVATLNLS